MKTITDAGTTTVRLAPSRWLGLAVLAGLTLFVATTASAQEIKKEAMDRSASGEIVAIDAAARSITLKGANDDGGVFYLNDETTIMSGDKKLGFGDLKKGQWVALDSDDHEGREVVTYLEVVDG